MTTEEQRMNKPNMLESAKILTLIEKEFVEKGLPNIEFAKYASEVLGFPVAESSIQKRRVLLNIPTTRTAARAVEVGGLLAISERLNTIELQLAADQKEFRGLAALVIELRQSYGVLVKAAKLKGTFEVPK